mgnify:CR=1 FL=1
MKKILGVVTLAILVCAVLVGCSGGSTVAPAWADREELVYNVTDTKTGETLGTMTVVNERRPEDKTLNGKTYDADGRTTVDVRMGEITVKTVFLTRQYEVIASQKTRTEGENVTVTNTYHSGKYYYYSVNGGEEKKLKTGSTGYTDSEYIYNYIRCYDLSSTSPASVKIADAATGTVKTVTTQRVSVKKLAVPYPSGEKEVDCYAVAVALSDTPSGSAIYAWYTPDSADYNLSGRSISPSKKFPVKMVENNITYTLTSMNVK